MLACMQQTEQQLPLLQQPLQSDQWFALQNYLLSKIIATDARACTEQTTAPVPPSAAKPATSGHRTHQHPHNTIECRKATWQPHLRSHCGTSWLVVPHSSALAATSRQVTMLGGAPAAAAAGTANRLTGPPAAARWSHSSTCESRTKKPAVGTRSCVCLTAC
jgi:hypothetical protein